MNISIASTSNSESLRDEDSFPCLQNSERASRENVNSFQRFQEKMKLNSPKDFGTNCWMSEACSCEGDCTGSA